MQNAWVLNQEILINPEIYHPCKESSYEIWVQLAYRFLRKLF